MFVSFHINSILILNNTYYIAKGKSCCQMTWSFAGYKTSKLSEPRLVSIYYPWYLVWAFQCLFYHPFLLRFFNYIQLNLFFVVQSNLLRSNYPKSTVDSFADAKLINLDLIAESVFKLPRPHTVEGNHICRVASVGRRHDLLITNSVWVTESITGMQW